VSHTAPPRRRYRVEEDASHQRGTHGLPPVGTVVQYWAKRTYSRVLAQRVPYAAIVIGHQPEGSIDLRVFGIGGNAFHAVCVTREPSTLAEHYWSRVPAYGEADEP